MHTKKNLSTFGAGGFAFILHNCNSSAQACEIVHLYHFIPVSSCIGRHRCDCIPLCNLCIDRFCLTPTLYTRIRVYAPDMGAYVRMWYGAYVWVCFWKGLTNKFYAYIVYAYRHKLSVCMHICVYGPTPIVHGQARKLKEYSSEAPAFCNHQWGTQALPLFCSHRTPRRIIEGNLEVKLPTL